MQQSPLTTILARCLRICCIVPGLLLLSSNGFTASLEEPLETWYQIEILVFANLKGAADDEYWPVVERSYPVQMVFIGPVTGDVLSPLNLGQLKQIDALEQLLSLLEPAETATATDNEFLFRSIGQKRPVYTGTTLSEDDLLAGITRELTPAEVPQEQITADPAPETDAGPTTSPAASNSMKPEDLSTLFETGNDMEAYRNLPEGQLTLSAVSKRIDQSSQYKLLYHSAWRQPVPAMADAIPILLQGGDQYDDMFELDGYVTISKSRYLHVDTHLWYTQFVPRSGQSSIVLPDNTQFYSQEDRSLLEKYPRVQRYEAMRENYLPAQTYPMIQSRKLKLAALHYLDHPAFGLMIKIEEYDSSGPGAGR